MPKIKNPDIDVSRFSYDPDTGVVTWLDGQRKGKPVGTPTDRGYLAATIQGKGVLVHRLAWRIHYDEWPDGTLDHRDGNKGRNVLSNLRLATPSGNGGNVEKPVTNTTGLKGVFFDARRPKPWRAGIKENGKTRHLGSFATKEEAASAYDWAAREVFGDFARPNSDVVTERPAMGRKPGTSPYFGVNLVEGPGGSELWRASITNKGKRRYIGRYYTDYDAGLAVDIASYQPIAYRGQKTRKLNHFMWGIAHLLGDDDIIPVPRRA